MKSKNKVLTSEEIKSKADDFLAEIEDSSTNKKTRKSPTQNFLFEIKDLLQIAIDKKVSYPQIKRDIKKIYGYTVSDQTIRGFAKNELEITLVDKEHKENKEKGENTPKSSLVMKEEMAQKPQDEESL